MRRVGGVPGRRSRSAPVRPCLQDGRRFRGGRAAARRPWCGVGAPDGRCARIRGRVDAGPPRTTKDEENHLPKKIRVYELAKELGLTNKEGLELALSLGIGVKSHSSSIEDAQADRVRRKADAEGLRRPVQPEEPAATAKAPAKSESTPVAAAPAAGGVARKPVAASSSGAVTSSSSGAVTSSSPGAVTSSGAAKKAAAPVRKVAASAPGTPGVATAPGPRLITSRPASAPPRAPEGPPNGTTGAAGTCGAHSHLGTRGQGAAGQGAGSAAAPVARAAASGPTAAQPVGPAGPATAGITPTARPERSAHSPAAGHGRSSTGHVLSRRLRGPARAPLARTRPGPVGGPPVALDAPVAERPAVAATEDGPAGASEVARVREHRRAHRPEADGEAAWRVAGHPSAGRADAGATWRSSSRPS